MDSNRIFKTFKTPNELLDIVLYKAANIRYEFDTRKRKLTTRNLTKGPYLAYADTLLKEHFGYGIETLRCINNNLTELPELPSTLKYLYCNNNQLTELPELPDTISYISCFNNQLTELPKLPSSLKYLSCHSNQLRELPELPKSLKELYCQNNKLTELPELPTLQAMYCDNNPGYNKTWEEYNKNRYGWLRDITTY